MSVVFEKERLIVSLGKRIAHVPCAMEGETLVVSLDDVAEWQVPPGGDIAIEDLGRITGEIENYCGINGLDVEFE